MQRLIKASRIIMNIKVGQHAVFKADTFVWQVKALKANIFILRPDAVLRSVSVRREKPQVDVGHKAIAAALQVDRRFAARCVARPCGAFARVAQGRGDIGDGLADDFDSHFAFGGKAGSLAAM